MVHVTGGPIGVEVEGQILFLLLPLPSPSLLTSFAAPLLLSFTSFYPSPLVQLRVCGGMSRQHILNRLTPESTSWGASP